MSWREMRNFSEMMRALGYPRLISIENFRTPNFSLLAEILKWLALRFDSSADVPTCTDSEQDRVLFIKMIVHFMATKTFIKINPKRLYKADGYAVKETLKLVNVLYTALNFEKKSEDDEMTEFNLSEILNVARVKQLQHARALASQLTSSGASLYSFMAREVDLRGARNEAIDRHLDSEWVEKSLEMACNTIREDIQKTENALVSITADEGTLDGKIDKRRNELDRNQKRLTTLQSVRPAYMEEYEQLEEELNIHYETYLTHFRNLSYLENLKEEMSRSDKVQYQEDDAAIKSAVEDLCKITEAAESLFQISGLKSGKNISQKGAKNGLSMFSGELGDFSNANADTGFDFDDDSSADSTSSDSADSDSSDSITNNSDSQDNQSNEDDVIKGLNIVGNGYQMSGNWSPGGVRSKQTPKIPNQPKCAVEDSQADLFNMSNFCNSTAAVLKTNPLDVEKGMGLQEVDRAFAAAIAEANALAESTISGGFGENFEEDEGAMEHIPTARIAVIPEATENDDDEEEDEGDDDDDF